MWRFWNQQPSFLSTCLPALPNWCNVLCSTMDGVSALWANCSLSFLSCTCLHSKVKGAVLHTALSLAIANTQSLSAICMWHPFYIYGQPARRFGMSTKRLLNKLLASVNWGRKHEQDIWKPRNFRMQPSWWICDTIHCTVACIWWGVIMRGSTRQIQTSHVFCKITPLSDFSKQALTAQMFTYI